MPVLSRRSPSQVGIGRLAWYLGGRVADEQAARFAAMAGGLITRGEAGAQQAERLRATGWAGPLLCDLASYERPPRDGRLLGKSWALKQRDLGVTEVLTPGVYVDTGDTRALQSAVRAGEHWAEMAGGARILLAVHWRWLTSGLVELVAELSKVDAPLALVLAHRTDPLGPAGTVDGLITVVRALPDIMLLRSDLAALGAVANGAALGAVGTSTTVRHLVPPGKKAGGVPGDRSPSVFDPLLLTWRLGSWLASLPRAVCPRCTLGDCDGQKLSRFQAPWTAPEALEHNRHAFAELVKLVIDRPPSERAEVFKAICASAELNAQQLSIQAGRTIGVSDQVRAWAKS